MRSNRQPARAGVLCHHCGRGYDERLFRDGRVVLCECGRWVERIAEDQRRRARADIDELARRADHVTSLLLYSDLAEVDIDIEIERLREYCHARFPEQSHLFEMIYESRWRRMREQGWARASDGGCTPD